MTTSYWVPVAHLPDRVADRVRITEQSGVITAVTTDTPPDRVDTVLDGVALPGFANAHSHAFHRALRGRTHADGGTFWTWRQQMYALASRLDPDRYFALARAVYAEMVLAGMTVVGEFHYLHHDHRGRPYADPHAMSEALVAAAAEAGLRLTLLDVCYLAGGLTEHGHQTLDPVQQRFSDGTVRGLGRPGPRLRRPRHRVRTHADRGGRPLGPRRAERGSRPAGHAASDRTAARPPQRAAGRERRRTGVLRLHAGRAAAPPRVARTDHHRGARHAPDRGPTSPCSGTPGPVSASAPPPNGTWPTASVPPVPCTTPAAPSAWAVISTP